MLIALVRLQRASFRHKSAIMFSDDQRFDTDSGRIHNPETVRDFDEPIPG